MSCLSFLNWFQNKFIWPHPQTYKCQAIWNASPFHTSRSACPVCHFLRDFKINLCGLIPKPTNVGQFDTPFHTSQSACPVCHFLSDFLINLCGIFPNPTSVRQFEMTCHSITSHFMLIFQRKYMVKYGINSAKMRHLSGFSTLIFKQFRGCAPNPLGGGAYSAIRPPAVFNSLRSFASPDFSPWLRGWILLPCISLFLT